MRTWTLAAGLCLGWLALACSGASGQNFRPFEGTSRGPFYTAPSSRPAVSPYLNLDIDNGGLPNYQTLVRPMLEQRELLDQQAAAQERLKRRFPGTANNQVQVHPASSDQRPGAVRFLDYSHYFGTAR